MANDIHSFSYRDIASYWLVVQWSKLLIGGGNLLDGADKEHHERHHYWHYLQRVPGHVAHEHIHRQRLGGGQCYLPCLFDLELGLFVFFGQTSAWWLVRDYYLYRIFYVTFYITYQHTFFTGLSSLKVAGTLTWLFLIFLVKWQLTCLGWHHIRCSGSIG